MSEKLPEPESFFNRLINPESDIGNSSLFLCFVSDTSQDHPPPAVARAAEVQDVNVGDKKLKLTIWDTGGRTISRELKLLTSYYRGADAVIMVYDVTCRDTFTYLTDIITKEFDLYSIRLKMVVAIKIDKKSKGQVTRKEGLNFAAKFGCLFVECRAMSGLKFRRCLEELVFKVLEHRRRDCDLNRDAVNAASSASFGNIGVDYGSNATRRGIFSSRFNCN